MKHKNNIQNPDDPEPPELRRANFPSLKKVWKGWTIGVAIILVVVLTLAIIFWYYGI